MTRLLWLAPVFKMGPADDATQRKSKAWPSRNWLKTKNPNFVRTTSGDRQGAGRNKGGLRTLLQSPAKPMSTIAGMADAGSAALRDG
jgi:hypothetical protein